MSKRAADISAPAAGLKNHSREESTTTADHAHTNYDADMGAFEDDFDDEFSSEDEMVEAGADGEHPNSDDEGVAAAGSSMDVDQQVYMPARQTLGKDQVLEPDPSAYCMLHALNVTWPCLSFDVLADDLGEERRVYPHTTYLVAGTQAERAKDNEVLVLKMSGLQKMAQYGDSDDDDDGASDTEDDPILESRALPCPSTTNRIRASPHSHTAASLAENGDVYVWDLAPHYASLAAPGQTIPAAAKLPAATLRMHGRTEGYALDWSVHGKLATGDCSGRIFVSTGAEAGAWKSAAPLVGHKGSVEELQWSPTERHVLASASADGSVKIWDVRADSRRAQLSVAVSSTDVNVMSWCRSVPHLLATGADDGMWGVWDLRVFPASAQGRPVSATASFSFHKDPITSVEFHPTEDSTIAVACADGTVTLWDLGVELDDEESRDTGGVIDVPPQLLFVHVLRDAKEVHWQRQAPGVVIGTGSDGFSIFKTISV